MKIKTTVLLILFASVLYALPFIPAIARTAIETWGHLVSHPFLLPICLLSGMLLLVGHMIRSYRDTILFSKAVRTSVKTQFGAFSVGSFCNVILPLRIGELIRADVLAQHYKISFSFSFVLICIERLFDVVILGTLACILLRPNISFMITALCFMAFIVFLAFPPSPVKKGIQKIAQIFNKQIQAKSLFTLWSLEYGLKRTLRPGIMVKYGILSIANWCIYIASLFPLIACLQGSDSLLQTSSAAFISLTGSIAPGALGDFSRTFESYSLSLTPFEPILLWATVIIPTAFIGLLVSIFGIRALPLLRPKCDTVAMPSDNKLARNADIASDQLHFMNDYYSGKPLAQKVTRQEIAGSIVMSKYFTSGGSGALTFQSLIDGKQCVTKLIPKNKSEALQAQYKWLRSHPHPHIVKAVAEHEDDDTYSIDIEFEESTTDILELVHEQSLAKSKQLLTETINMLATHVWGKLAPPPTDSFDQVESYIQTHIKRSLALAAGQSPILGEMMSCEAFIINGTTYPGLNTLLNKLSDENIRFDLANHRVSESIHGDLICDNMVYSKSKDAIILLDPVPDGNCFNGPVFDFGKLSQSLQIGYELLLRDTRPVEAQIIDNICLVSFIDYRTAILEELWNHVYTKLAPQYLNESEMRTVLFLGATNYFRRMKHQAVQYPQNAMKFYAQGIRFLSEYVSLVKSQQRSGLE